MHNEHCTQYMSLENMFNVRYSRSIDNLLHKVSLVKSDLRLSMDNAA